MDIMHIFEPTDLQCGQAVIAMVTGKKVSEVVDYLGNDRETTLKEMRLAFSHYGFKISENRTQVQKRNELPELCLLSLETPRCWHWSLYSAGKFYDPEHGVLEDFPESNRRYYWKIRFFEKE